MRDDTRKAVRDPAFAAGLSLFIQGMMEKFGIMEFEVNPLEVSDEFAMEVSRTGTKSLKIRLIRREDVPE